MNDENTNAARLAEWLEAGGEPPEALDPDVLAVVYALQPDRAPKPRVTLDEILGGVKEGPFAISAPTTVAPAEFPQSEGRDARGGLRVHDGEGRVAATKPRRAPSRFWMAPALGVVLAAAAAVAFVFPIAAKLGGLSRPGAEFDQVAEPQMAPRSAAIPEMPEGGAVAPPAAAPVDARPKDDSALPAEPSPAKAAAPAPPAPEQAPVEAVADAVSAGPGATPSTVTATTPPPAPMASPAPAEERLQGAGGDAGLELAREEKAPALDERVIAEAERADADDYEMDAPKSKKSESRRAPTTSVSPSAGASASAPAARAASADEASSARDEATPLDYNPSWYTSDPAVVALYVTPLGHEAAGDRAAAASAWRELIPNPRVDVGQDAALRAGKAFRALSRNSEALLAVDAGLRRSSANTAFRAALYALRGDLFSAVGKNPEAEAAWREAARLNMSR